MNKKLFELRQICQEASEYESMTYRRDAMREVDPMLVLKLLDFVETVNPDLIQDLSNLDHEDVNQYTNELEEIIRICKALEQTE